MEEGNNSALVNALLCSLCPGPLYSSEGLQVHSSVWTKDAGTGVVCQCVRGLIVAPNEGGRGALFWHLGPAGRLLACVPSQKERSRWKLWAPMCISFEEKLSLTWMHPERKYARGVKMMYIYVHIQVWFEVSGATGNTALISVVHWVFFAEEPKCLQVI